MRLGPTALRPPIRRRDRPQKAEARPAVDSVLGGVDSDEQGHIGGLFGILFGIRVLVAEWGWDGREHDQRGRRQSLEFEFERERGRRRRFIESADQERWEEG